MLETRKVDNNKIRKALFVNIYVNYICTRYFINMEYRYVEVQ